MPGPAPIPIERKRATGNPGKRSLPQAVVHLAYSADIPPRPASLSEVGGSVWERLWKAGQGWLSTQTDLDIMTRLCEAHDEREAIRRDLAESGYLVQGSKGQLRPNPLIRTLRELESQLTRLEALCGFNPSDRGRLGFAEVKRASKLDELITRRASRAG
jgi:P27 family predicted phage terminase small subunit